MSKFKKVDQCFWFTCFDGDEVYRLKCKFKSRSLIGSGKSNEYLYRKIQPEAYEYNVNDSVILKLFIKKNGKYVHHKCLIPFMMYELIDVIKVEQEGEFLNLQITADNNTKIITTKIPFITIADKEECKVEMSVDFITYDIDEDSPFEYLAPIAYHPFDPKRSNKRLTQYSNIVKENKLDIGITTKLHNRRISLGYNKKENYYGMHWKHLTENKKVCREIRAFSPEAMLAIVKMFYELQGPLPKGFIWKDGNIKYIGEE